MPKYLLNHKQYTRLVRRCADINEDYPHKSTLNILMDLLHVQYDYDEDTFDIPEKLMQKIAIANICDMALQQFRDSNGEIDYAGLSVYSRSVLNSIIYQFL